MSSTPEESDEAGTHKTSMDVLRALAARAAEADPGRKPFLRDLVMTTFQKMSPQEQLLAIESGVLEMGSPRTAQGHAALEKSKNVPVPRTVAAAAAAVPPADATGSDSITAKVQSRPLNASAVPFNEPTPVVQGAKSTGGRAAREPRESRRRGQNQNQNQNQASTRAPPQPTIEEPIIPTKSIVLDPCAFRTIMCPYYLRNTVCPTDGRCMYCHGKGQLRTREQNVEDGITTLSAIDEYMRVHANDEDASSNNNNNTTNINNNNGGTSSADDGNGASTIERNAVAARFRTQLCKAFETGCRRGATCPFAHGPGQLRTRQENARDGLVTEAAVRHYVQTGELPVRPSAAVGSPNSTTANSGSGRDGASSDASAMGKRAQHALMEAEQREATKEYTIATAFRTQLCPYASSDQCPRGGRCQRAHGTDQLRTHQQNVDDGITTFTAANFFKDHGFPPGWGSGAAPPQPQLVTEIPKPSTFRTRVCSYYGPGKCCKHGDWCVYAHGDGQMRTEEQNIADGIVTLEAIEEFLQKQTPLGGTPQDTRESFVASCMRTQICPNSKKGSCELGNKCRRAHTKAQLRTRERNIADGIVTRQAVEFFLENGYPPPAGTDLTATTLTSPTTLASPTSLSSPTGFYMLAPVMSSLDAKCDLTLGHLQSVHDQGGISPMRQPHAQQMLVLWHQLRELRHRFFDFAGTPIALTPEDTAIRNITYAQFYQMLS